MVCLEVTMAINWDGQRPAVVVDVSATKFYKGAYVSPDGDIDNARLLIGPDGFHFTKSDFSDFKFDKVTFEALNSGNHELSFDTSGHLLVDGKILVDENAKFELKSAKMVVGSDLDTYTQEGFFYSDKDKDVASMTNAPTTHAMTMQVYRAAGVVQIVTEYTTNDSAGTFIRSYYDVNNIWSPWRRVITSDSSGNIKAPSGALLQEVKSVQTKVNGLGTYYDTSSSIIFVRSGKIVTAYGNLKTSVDITDLNSYHAETLIPSDCLPFAEYRVAIATNAPSIKQKVRGDLVFQTNGGVTLDDVSIGETNVIGGTLPVGTTIRISATWVVA